MAADSSWDIAIKFVHSASRQASSGRPTPSPMQSLPCRFALQLTCASTLQECCALLHFYYSTFLGAVPQQASSILLAGTLWVPILNDVTGIGHAVPQVFVSSIMGCWKVENPIHQPLQHDDSFQFFHINHLKCVLASGVPLRLCLLQSYFGLRDYERQIASVTREYRVNKITYKHFQRKCLSRFLADCVEQRSVVSTDSDTP